MIAVDTSTLISYFSGEKGHDVDLFDQALLDGMVVVPPIVLAEFLSDPALPPDIEKTILQLPLIDVIDGLWIRAGKMRSFYLLKKRKCRLADSLIAQMCIDSNIPLITRDKDFNKYCVDFDLTVL